MIKNSNILEIICNNKRSNVSKQKSIVSFDSLKKNLEVNFHRKTSFKQALVQSNTGIIAEFKRRSPSKGWIYKNAEVVPIVKEYEKMGAAAISVLTDEVYFGAYSNDFTIAHSNIINIPILRKDFIIDEYQIYQSKIIGADMILLIAACLSTEESFRFAEIAHKLDMEVLLEIHSEEELNYIHPNIDVVGINNRNLKTFVTNIHNSIELSNNIPKEYVKISESGLLDPKIVILLKELGFNGFLIGEHFMQTHNPAQALKKFIDQL
ncbi:MAG: indole-3-glycerol phosphate synthase TrpC [Bacteroidales bacterium OttesenSCG-928-I14]|jgi:indole-3-glycerol phosphate synthase|nr:indole-3-glycerol phosphate synthase TrpC [Bacteroidales bacterium OttesenSCG-928-I14]